MRILFFARHFTYLRNFESVLVQLAEEGHQVHVAAERKDTLGGTAMLERLAARFHGISFGEAPKRTDGWYGPAVSLRLGLDYLRYLEPAYAEMPRLRQRARERAPRVIVRLGERGVFASATGRRWLARILWALEQAVPPSAEISRYIRDEQPDVVLLTPLIGVVASPQLDCLYAARALGIPTALAVWSWDHLSSKALIRSVPDRVLVWNETQRDEAVRLHGVPPEQVVVTGAQCFDQWFGRQPSRPRAEFCRRVGLLDDGPFLLWVCSSLFRNTLPEAPLVERWIAAIRASGDPALRHVNILVRPHPQRMGEWEGTDIARHAGVAFWGGMPIDAESRDDYFDSLHYSAAVVGLNTSAFIEGAIADRPIYTVLLPEFHENQEGTIHFHYLLQVAGGLLRASRTFDAHVSDLAAAVRGDIPDPARSRRFVEAFVRPQGLHEPSTPRFVAAVHTLLDRGTTAAAPQVSALARYGLWAVRRLRSHPATEAAFWSDQEAAAIPERRRRAAEEPREKERLREERIRRRAAEKAAYRAERNAAHDRAKGREPS